DVHAEHLLKLAPQVTGQQMQRLFLHRAVFDGIYGGELLEAALQAFDQRALARAHRPHQVEDLPALLALQGRGVKVAHDLRHRPLDAEELLGEEVVDAYRLVLEEPFDPRVLALEDVARAPRHYHVVDPRVVEPGYAPGLPHPTPII